MFHYQSSLLFASISVHHLKEGYGRTIIVSLYMLLLYIIVYYSLNTDTPKLTTLYLSCLIVNYHITHSTGLFFFIHSWFATLYELKCNSSLYIIIKIVFQWLNQLRPVTMLWMNSTYVITVYKVTVVGASISGERIIQTFVRIFKYRVI